MSFIFCDENLALGEPVTIQSRAAQHLKARRLKVGESVELQSPEAVRMRVRVESVGKVYRVLPYEQVSIPESSKRTVVLLQPLIQEQALDLVLQKTTELGVTEVRVFIADNSPHALKAERVAHKMRRWNDILLSACEQSGRASVPLLSVHVSLEEALLQTPDAIFIGSASAQETRVHIPDTATYVVGPEGGLSEAEFSLLAKRNPLEIRLSPFTLRSETAALVGVAHLLLA